MESFLHNKAIGNEKRLFSRTSLVVDEERNFEIIGYFTLLIKNFKLDGISGTVKKKLVGNKDADVFNAILIAQLGRSNVYKGIVSGTEILNLALHNCKLIHDLSALRVVCVEYENVPYLNDFYAENQFRYLTTNPDNHLILSYVRL